MVTLVWFWATWEHPSKMAFPRFEEAWRRLGPRGFRILAVSVDEQGDGVATAGREWGATFPYAWDEGRRITTCFAPESEPQGYVIDKAGVVRGIFPGYHDGDDREIEVLVERLLAEPWHDQGRAVR